MIDAWEILGRMATYDDFRQIVYEAARADRPCVTKATRAKFDPNDYGKLLAALRPHIKRPISMMGLGEILWPLTDPKFRAALKDVATTIKASKVRVHRRNYLFYVALGAMVTDRKLQDHLIGGGAPYSQFDLFGFNKLSHADRRDLVRLFQWKSAGNTTSKSDMTSRSDGVCHTDWTVDCFLKTEYWDYDSGPHTHPVPLA